jgi:hypothetical protein
VRQEITDADFWDQLTDFRTSAWRFEQQPAYAVDYEGGQFAAFLAGHPVPLPDNPELADWLANIRRHTGAGRSVGRVRVVDNPITDYQRWLRWSDWWNQQAGEVIQYLPRALAFRGGLLPAAQGPDWWLLDDQRLMLMHIDGDGERTKVELLEDEPLVQQAREWRAVAIALARTVES